MIRPLTKLLQESNYEVPEFFHSLNFQGRRLKSASKIDDFPIQILNLFSDQLNFSQKML